MDVSKVFLLAETFAMDRKSCSKGFIFDLKKHDGNFRYLLPGDAQMAGRAGRRGFDEVGAVISAC